MYCLETLGPLRVLILPETAWESGPRVSCLWTSEHGANGTSLNLHIPHAHLGEKGVLIKVILKTNQ